MEDTTESSDGRRSALLSDPSLRALLVRFLRKRVPDAEVDDLAQATLADALAARIAPSDAIELRRWLHGIARNKVADFYRERHREVPIDPDINEAAADSAPLGARDLLRWAEKELPDGEQAAGTLDWMLREGDGEKLETIAHEEQVPAPRVRQRIARLRRHFRARWAAELAAIGALSLVLFAGLWFVRRFRTEPHVAPIASEPVTPRDLDRVRELRRVALEECDHREYRACLDGLDLAKRLDEQGDAAEAIVSARRAAANALASEPVPTPSASEASPPRPAPAASGQPPPRPAPSPTAIPSKAAPRSARPQKTKPFSSLSSGFESDSKK